MKHFHFDQDIPSGKLTLYPENDLEARMVFTWLDFVKYKIPTPAVEVDKKKPAAKIKCVAWDLDNTLWKGVFIETKHQIFLLIKKQ